MLKINLKKLYLSHMHLINTIVFIAIASSAMFFLHPRAIHLRPPRETHLRTNAPTYIKTGTVIAVAEYWYTIETDKKERYMALNDHLHLIKDTLTFKCSRNNKNRRVTIIKPYK